MSESLLDAIRASDRACLSLAEVSRLFEMDVRTISRGCRDGQLPSLTIGRRTVIPRLPLLALLETGHA